MPPPLLRWVDTQAMASSCLAVVQACLSGEPWQGSCACSPKDGPVCTAAPNRVTLLHALAMAAAPSATVASAAAPAPQAALDATLDRHNKYPLHLLLEAAGLQLTETKKPSRFYARFHGASALEVAVSLGREAVAAALLAAGASVRPQAFDALLLYCPPRARDGMVTLLAGSQACPALCLLPRWPDRYRHAVQALLCCAVRGRQQTMQAAAAAGPDQQQAAAAATGAALLASLPHEVLLRIAALAAAPLSSWQ